MTERLKQARESRGLSLRQIAETVKVSTRTIAALEDARIDQLPPGIYRRSLVRAVAGEVGLPPEATLREFLDAFPDELPPPGTRVTVVDAPVRSAGAWRRVLATFGAVVPLLAGVAYFAGQFSSANAPVEPVAAVAPTSGDWQPEIVPAGGFTEAPPPAVHPVTMLITLSARCRLEVVADGALYAGRVFDAGESLRVSFSDAVELSGSNAGAVQYSINGQAGRMLGGDGQPLDVRIGRADYNLFLSFH